MYSHGPTDYDCQTPCFTIYWQTRLAISLTKSFGKIVLAGFFTASLFHCSSTHSWCSAEHFSGVQSWDDRLRLSDTLFSNSLANSLGNFAHKILWQNCADRPLCCKSVSLQIYLQQFTDKFTWQFHKTNSLAKLYLHISLLQVYFTADLLTCRCIAAGLR